VEVLLSDGYDALGGQRFDAILSNLPAHRGQQADSAVAERFIAGAPAHLREDGGAWLVANKALPYELPAARAFRRVRVAAGDGRYKVLHCDQPVPQRPRRR
jgi:16S rRNA G1207 methylase RsmC